MILPKSWLENPEPSAPAPLLGDTANRIQFETRQGFEVRAAVLRFTPQSITFELCSPESFVRLSEVLNEFKVFADDREIYKGKAIVTSTVNSGTTVVCEVSIENAVLDMGLFQLGDPEKVLPIAFKGFMHRWQKFYKILPEYKLAIADLQNLLQELRLWLDQLEIGMNGLPAEERRKTEQAILRDLPAAPIVNSLFHRFEQVAATVPAELIPAHRTFCHRQLHPLLLCAPFMYRIFAKPLGYAGDYEMIDMIIRNEYEGSSLFAKFLHAYIIAQAPAESVRIRAAYFAGKFVEETNRVARTGRVANIFSLGCGPAREVENFMAQHSLSDQARFSLLDFSEETLKYTGDKMQRLRQKFSRKTEITMVKKSVYSFLKETSKPLFEERYDLIYCSGLYDYLDDSVCERLNTYLYERLSPGGALIVTNFDPYNPIRQIMEHIFDWFLIHRDGKQLAALSPKNASPDDCKVTADPTGCNVFLEARKPM